MKFLRGFYMAMGMFLGIPLPFHIWDESLTTIMVATLPLVGLVVGGIWFGAATILLLPTFPIMIVAAILAVVPFWVAGFIHLDGYMDTSDAILSWRPLADKLRILKDPHVGAFAVVMLVILFLLHFAAVYAVVDGGRYLALLVGIPVVSRSCSAFAIFTMKHMDISHYLPLLKNGNHTMLRGFVMAMVVLVGVLSYVYAGFTGLLVLLAVICGYGFAIRRAAKRLQGISGDLLGYGLVIGELCGLIALALLQGVNI